MKVKSHYYKSYNRHTRNAISLFSMIQNDEGKEPDFTPKLCPEGSEFRQQVWQELLNIPYGKTTTYGTLSKQIAIQLNKQKMSAQAIGGAVGHNPISIIIPCHRVVGANGTMTGYAGGIWRKEYLLKLETY